MYVIKGFAVHSAFAINTPGQNNLFGELSTQSLTYSKEKGLYKNTSVNDIGFVSFLSTEDGVEKAIPTAIANHIVLVSQYVYEMTILEPGVAIDKTTLLLSLTNEFAGTASDFSAGSIESDGTYYVPDWIQWTINADGDAIRVWFIDEAFKNQYDEYSITFIPPFDNLDDFFLGGVTVEQRLNAITPAQIGTKLQAAKGNNPETFIRIEEYDYYDPLDENRIVPSYWGVLGYGIAANNDDILKEELIQFILGNSSHTREEWVEILPDIFKRTEFVLIPHWDHYAIEPRTTTPGIYSPITQASVAAQLLKDILPSDYTAFHVDTYYTIMGFPFKSISVSSIGNVENRGGQFRIFDIFPDFINVSSTSLDFNRMSEDTKNWSIMIHEMIVLAEDTEPNTSIPLEISKLVRDDILYLSRTYQNVQYLVATKYSIDNL